MKQAIVFLSMFLFLCASVLWAADEMATDEPVAEIEQIDDRAITSEVLVLEDGTEEVQISIPSEETVRMIIDDRVLTIEKETQAKIQVILKEINQLADKSDEGELQKQIEKVKLDAEIARFKIYMEDAEEDGNIDLANEVRDEIQHLENLDQPVIGVPEEQPAS